MDFREKENFYGRIRVVCDRFGDYIQRNILHRAYQGLFHRVLRLSIAKKLLLSYLPLSILLIVISLYSLSRLDKLNTINTAGLHTHIPMMDITEDMSDTLLDQELYAGRYAIMQSPEMLALFWEKSQEFEDLTKQIEAIMEGADTVISKDILSLHNKYNDLNNELFSLTGKTTPKETMAIADRIEAAQSAITIHIENIHDKALRAQNSGILTATETGHRAFQILSLLCVLGIVLGIGTAAIISRTIFTSIRKLKKATKSVSNGEFKKMKMHAPIEDNDELGELAYAFNDMIARLKELDTMHLDMSPLTRLPGGVAIEDTLKKRLIEKRPVSLCLADLDNFKAFNDRYGYSMGNEMIVATAEIVKAAVKKHGGLDDFVGHIGGDDFIVITAPKSHSRICTEIIKRFDDLAPSFYSEEDRAQGCIEGKTRQGQDISYPLASISIAVVTNTHHNFSCHIEMSEEVAELKGCAKAITGSNFVVDKRRDDYGADKAISEDRSLH
ncbi:MAG: diguanylate cyclase [Deltaproteobacteria bacterium]|nr:diguanylate cyclase [Deltaproteobacteria bacterium]